MVDLTKIIIYTFWGVLLLFAIRAERQEVSERGGYPAVYGYTLDDISNNTEDNAEAITQAITLYDGVVGWRRTLIVATAFSLLTGYLLGILSDVKACLLLGGFSFSAIYHLAQYEKYHIWFPVKAKVLEHVA